MAVTETNDLISCWMRYFMVYCSNSASFTIFLWQKKLFIIKKIRNRWLFFRIHFLLSLMKEKNVNGKVSIEISRNCVRWKFNDEYIKFEESTLFSFFLWNTFRQGKKIFHSIIKPFQSVPSTVGIMSLLFVIHC